MNAQELINAMDDSIRLADSGSSKLSGAVLAMEGMSGAKNRHFLNNLMSHAGVRYLEIGTWKGSTLVSSLYKNSPEFSLAIDNFSQFGSPRDDFHANCTAFLGTTPNFLDADCFTLDPKTVSGLSNINVYFYDGEHSPQSQCGALAHYLPVLADEFIFIVDDWNWSSVRGGTQDGIAGSNLEIVHKWEHIGPDDGTRDVDGWWNGLFVAVMKKKV